MTIAIGNQCNNNQHTCTHTGLITDRVGYGLSPSSVPTYKLSFLHPNHTDNRCGAYSSGFDIENKFVLVEMPSTLLGSTEAENYLDVEFDAEQNKVTVRLTQVALFRGVNISVAYSSLPLALKTPVKTAALVFGVQRGVA